MALIPYPKIDPVLVDLGPLQVRWYGLAYIAGFIVAALIMRSLVRRWKIGLTDDDMLDIVLAGIVGLVVGARLGYVLFYGWDHGTNVYLQDPLSVFSVWDGGMSFHGGLLGILLVGWWIARRKGVPPLRLFDLGAVGAPLGIFFGRLANFINGELWGRPTDVPWAMIFPGTAGNVPRHPSQLYEALLEGLVIFIVLWVLSRKKRPEGLYIGTLLVLYAVFRTFVEFFREPDAQLGFIAGPFTMGQLLTLPVFAVGVWLVVRACRAEGEGSEGGGEETAAKP